jgi:hypothetical protein
LIATIAAATIAVAGLLVVMTVRPPGSQAQATAAQPPASGAEKHTVTVKFDYSFVRMHSCGPKNKDKLCVKQFNVYNLTQDGQRHKLFSLPAPPDAKTVVQGLTATSPELPFSPGQHMIAVTAESNAGSESSPMQCQALIDIQPGASPSAN